ncbi:unnamed protein product, partial [Rotaria magnacalcarata]
KRPEQCSDNLNKRGPSVRSKAQSPDGDKVKTYAEVCKPNVNIQSAFKTNQANNNSNTYTVPSMPSITSNQYPFAGQHPYPFMMPNYFANTSIPQVGQQNAVPQYIINQSRVSNPPELPTFKTAYPLEELTYGHNSTLRERYIHALADDTKAHVISSTAAFKALGQSIPYESYVL